MNKVNRIVVTGGSGFIGSYICKILAACHPKIDVVSLSNESVQSQKDKDPYMAKFKNIQFVQADVLDKESDSLKDVLQDSDGVIHTVGALLDGGPLNYKEVI